MVDVAARFCRSASPPPWPCVAEVPWGVTTQILPMHEKRRELGGVSRQTILDTAARLMAERGYDGTSLSALVKESGFSASSIYWHFSSKEGVLVAVMERAALRFFEAVERSDLGAGSAPEQLRRMFVQTGLALITEPDHAQFLQLQLRFRLNSEWHEGKSFYKVCDSVHRRGIEVMCRQIRRAYQQNGEETAGHVASRLGELAVAMIDGVYLSRRSSPLPETEVLLEQAASVLAAMAESVIGE